MSLLANPVCHTEVRSPKQCYWLVDREGCLQICSIRNQENQRQYFSGLIPCILTGGYQIFGAVCCLCLQVQGKQGMNVVGYVGKLKGRSMGGSKKTQSIAGQCDVRMLKKMSL